MHLYYFLNMNFTQEGDEDYLIIQINDDVHHTSINKKEFFDIQLNFIPDSQKFGKSHFRVT